MKFELRRLEDYSDDVILAELRRIAALSDADVLTQAEFDKRGPAVEACTVQRRFGGWHSLKS